MGIPWVEKYRPKKRSDLVGNEIAINGFQVFLRDWKYGTSKIGVILIGPAGCGKTSAVYALAHDFGYNVSEVNASDTRAKKTLQNTLGKAVEFQQLDHFGEKRLILMDEVDGLSGQKDRGGINEFLKILKKSIYPIICTANDPESDKVEALIKRGKLRKYQFERLDEFEIFDTLAKISQIEGFDINEMTLETIAENSAGDLRAAINELESHFHGTLSIQLEKRDKMYVLSDILNNLFRAKTSQEAQKALSNVPSDYSKFLLYIFDEAARQCKTSEEVYHSYEQIALADLTLARIRSTQNWSLLRHFFTFIGSGIVHSRSKKYYSKIRALPKYPTAFLARGIAKRRLKGATELAPKFAERLHIGKRRFIYYDFPLLSKIILGEKGAEIAAWLDLNDNEIEILQNLKPTSVLIDNIEAARTKVGKIRMELGLDIGKRNLGSLENYLDNLRSNESDPKEDIVKENEDQLEITDKTQHSLDDFF